MGKIMKNIFRFSALLALCSLIGLAACTPEELSTDQFEDSAVVFGAFAPNPVVRGAELRIMGSNLDKIVEVQIPGAEPITEIELVSAGRDQSHRSSYECESSGKEDREDHREKDQ